MRIILMPITLSMILLGACVMPQKHIRGVSEDAPVPNEAMAVHGRTSLAELQTGHGVYMRKCGECHTHLLPDDISSEDWHVVVPDMAWNAGIDPLEQEALTKYLITAKSIQNPSNPSPPIPSTQ